MKILVFQVDMKLRQPLMERVVEDGQVLRVQETWVVHLVEDFQSLKMEHIIVQKTIGVKIEILSEMDME